MKESELIVNFLMSNNIFENSISDMQQVPFNRTKADSIYSKENMRKENAESDKNESFSATNTPWKRKDSRAESRGKPAFMKIVKNSREHIKLRQHASRNHAKVIELKGIEELEKKIQTLKVG